MLISLFHLIEFDEWAACIKTDNGSCYDRQNPNCKLRIFTTTYFLQMKPTL